MHLKPLRKGMLLRYFEEMSTIATENKENVSNSLCDAGGKSRYLLNKNDVNPSNLLHESQQVKKSFVDRVKETIDLTKDTGDETLLTSLINKSTNEGEKAFKACGICGKRGHYRNSCPIGMLKAAEKLDLSCSSSINWGDNMLHQKSFSFGSYVKLSELKHDLAKWSVDINKGISYPTYFRDSEADKKTRMQGGKKMVACCDTMCIGDTLWDSKNLTCKFRISATYSDIKKLVYSSPENQYYHNIGNYIMLFNSFIYNR